MSNKEKEVLLSIIELYKDMPYLWMKDHKDYLNKNMRNEGFKVLVEVYKTFDTNATIKTLKKKLENMRTNYAKELKKTQASKQTSTGTEEIYIPTLWYFEAFNFLGDGTESCRIISEPLYNVSCSFPNQNTEADECHQREVPVTRRRYPYNKSKAQKRKSNDTTDLQEVQENMANAITIINRIIKDQQKHNYVEEDEIDLYGKLLVKRLRLLSQRESQELMYEIDGMVLNRLHNQKDPMSFNNEESVSPPPASPVTIRVVKRSVSPCSPYTTPAASPCSP